LFLRLFLARASHDTGRALGCLYVHVRGDVLVKVRRDTDGTVAEAIARNLEGYATSQ